MCFYSFNNWNLRKSHFQKYSGLSGVLGQLCKADYFTLLNVFWEESGGVRLSHLLANSSEDCGILTFYSL